MCNVDNKNVVEVVKEISECYKQLKEREQFLKSQMSLIDKEITDIHHAAEFFSLNASQGYKLYKMLHEACVRRRECKMELQKISILLGNNINKDNICKIEQRIDKLDFDSSKYEPRVLKELFKS